MARIANEHMARRVANELIDSLGIASYPVEPIVIAEQLGFPVDEVPGFPPHCYGALSIVDGRFRILVSDACPTEGHRRFTVSHEVGHAAIEGHTDTVGWIDQGGRKVALSEGHYRSWKDPVEVEADHFASELLLPDRWARPLVDSLPAGLDAVRELAERFGASLPCAAIRYARLSTAPVIIVLANGPSVEWVAANPHVQQAEFFRYNAVRTISIPRGSAARRLADAPAAVAASARDSSTDFLRDWFPRAPKDTAVHVDALGLGSYGRVLSVLVCRDLPDLDELYVQEQLGDDDREGDGDWRSQMRREAGYGE